MTSPGRFRTRRSRRATALRPHLEPLLGAQLQLAVQFRAGVLAMDEITESAPNAALPAVQTTARLAEVGNRREFTVDRPRSVPARVQIIAGLLSAVFVFEPRVDVADQVVVVVVADDELLELAVLAHLAPDVFVEGVEVVLQLGRVHAVLGVEGGVLVEVGHEDGLRVGGLDVFAGAAIAVAAGADLIVEGAVDFILLCSEDGGEEVSHFDGGARRLLFFFGVGELGCSVEMTECRYS